MKADYLAQVQDHFESSCSKCHDLPNPSRDTDQQWFGLINQTAPKARLSAEQTEMVYDYVTTTIFLSYKKRFKLFLKRLFK